MLHYTARANLAPDRIAQLIVSPRAYARRVQLLAAYRWLRKNQPVAKIIVDGFDPFWAVSSYKDVSTVSVNNALFQNGVRSTTLVPQASDNQARRLMSGSPHIIRSLVQMDAPDHTAYRRLTQGWFTPKAVLRLEPAIRAIAGACLDRVAGDATKCEFVKDVARPFALRVLLTVLGLHHRLEPEIERLTRMLFGSGEGGRQSREATDPGRHAEAITQVHRGFLDCLERTAAARCIGRSYDDLFGAIASGSVEGRMIDSSLAASYLALLGTAGHDTTASTIAGAIWALAENPGILPQLEREPTLLSAFVNEAIRWTTPVQHFMRTAAHDTQLRGQKIARGDWLMLCYLSANRDEEQFDEPDNFKLERKEANVAFGAGQHICLGRDLARLEIRIFFEEFLRRVSAIEMVGTPQRSSSIFVGGPKHLPLMLTLR